MKLLRFIKDLWLAFWHASEAEMEHGRRRGCRR